MSPTIPLAFGATAICLFAAGMVDAYMLYSGVLMLVLYLFGLVAAVIGAAMSVSCVRAARAAPSPAEPGRLLVIAVGTNGLALLCYVGLFIATYLEDGVFPH